MASSIVSSVVPFDQSPKGPFDFSSLPDADCVRVKRLLAAVRLCQYFEPPHPQLLTPLGVDVIDHLLLVARVPGADSVAIRNREVGFAVAASDQGVGHVLVRVVSSGLFSRTVFRRRTGARGYRYYPNWDFSLPSGSLPEGFNRDASVHVESERLGFSFQHPVSDLISDAGVNRVHVRAGARHFIVGEYVERPASSLSRFEAWLKRAP